MTNNDFERFVSDIKSDIAQCLRGRLGKFDMPGISDADSLKEQFEEHYLGGKPCDARIDSKALDAYSHEVIDEWHRRKKAWDREEAIRGGRM